MNKKNLLTSISIVELEDRFETSAVALELDRCSGNEVGLSVAPGVL